ncbi:MAG: glycine zipper 2TM domain-containing protein [Betaproteobacteria bacterium]
METQATPSRRMHPLLATAAVAVIVAAGVAVGAMTGLLPSGTAKQSDQPLLPRTAVLGTGLASGTSSPATDATIKPQREEALAQDSTLATKPAPKPATPAAKPKVVAQHPRPAPEQLAQAPASRVAPQPESYGRDASAGSQPLGYPPVPADYRPQPSAQSPAQPNDYRPAPVVQRQRCVDCGVVESMREVSRPGEGTGLGAVAGGIGGLILGKQVGNGKGSNVAAVLGAAGGAYAGNEIEKRTRAGKTYELSVRMEDGSYRTISLNAQPSWRTGDHVRVVNGTLQPM